MFALFRRVRLLWALDLSPFHLSIWRLFIVAATYTTEDIEALVREATDLRDVTNAIITAGNAVADAEHDVSDAEAALDTAESVLVARKQDKEDLEVQATAQVDYLSEWIDFFKGTGPRPTNDPTPNTPAA